MTHKEALTTQWGRPPKAVLKRERLVVLLGLAGLSAFGWAYLLHMRWGLQSPDASLRMPDMQPWKVADLAPMFAMWVIMMTAMMVPAASPAVVMFAALNRRRREQRRPFVSSGVFLIGFLAAWTALAALAALSQWSLHATALRSPGLVNAGPLLGGGLLVAAGIFQWTPLKHACLARCRSPLGFFLTRWREGTWGAFRMGLRHGGDCVGCCGPLMSLLLVTGVMNLLWMGIMTAFVLVEKTAPAEQWVSRVAGLALVGWGVWMVAGALV